MQVTRVKVRLSDHDVVKAYVDITLDDCFKVYDLKVLREVGGYRLAMPQRKWRKGGHYTIAYGSTAECRRMIDEAVMGVLEGCCQGLERRYRPGSRIDIQR
jgi:stage V sporulation protein G